MRAQIHPGAKLYFDGDEKSFFDKHGDMLFYGSMALGSLTSLLAALWKFIGFGASPISKGPSAPFSELAARARSACGEADLESVEADIDAIIRSELEKQADENYDSSHATTLSLATHRLEHLITQRRLNGQIVRQKIRALGRATAHQQARNTGLSHVQSPSSSRLST